MRSLQLLVPRRREVTGAVVSAFESETQALFLRTRPYSEHAILHVLVAIIVISIGLMAVTKLDRVVTGGGRLVSSEGKLYVEPLQKAIVRDIHVKVGDLVSKGEILATLDPTFASADLAQLEQKVASGQTEVTRLQAEQDGKPYRPTGGNAYEVLQQSIFQQRQSEYRSSLADFDARVQNAEASINRLQKDAATYRQRLKIASDVEEMNVTLERQGWNSKLKTMAASDNRMEMDRMLTEALNQIAENQHTANALRAQRAVYVERWHSDSGRDLVTARNTLEQAQQDLVKAQKLRDLVNVEAPVDAIVLKIGKASVGSVSGSDGSSSSDPLFTLARLDSPIEAELEVDSKDIGFIQPGDPAEVKLDAYRFLEHGTAKGVIKTISEGSFTSDENNTPRPPYFKVLVTLTDVHLRNVPASFRLIPGMTLTGDIVVGKRSIMSYLVEGALRTGSEAMREP
jgi:HlyD family type I secretion membrane fusion protein